jgi:hypothetical protein
MACLVQAGRAQVAALRQQREDMAADKQARLKAAFIDKKIQELLAAKKAKKVQKAPPAKAPPPS